MTDKTTKAELYKMLAEAVRNTQSAPAANAEPIVDAGAEPKHRKQSGKGPSIPKKAKSKALRRPAGRNKKRQMRR